MTNKSRGNAEQANNEFNNVESVESVYSSDIIDIIADNSAQLLGSEQELLGIGRNAANDAVIPGDIYSMDNARLSKHSKALERRAYKSRLTDRRADTRLTASGEIQQDRREANQIANIDAIRPTDQN